MEQETAERIAIALEGIEIELKRTADAAEAGLAFNREIVVEQREQRLKAEEAQRQFAARLGMGVGPAGARLGGFTSRTCFSDRIPSPKASASTPPAIPPPPSTATTASP